jgi:maltooligosyltrehalose trehalohydrolase
MTAQWLDDLHHAIHVTITGERDGYYGDFAGLSDVARAYGRGFVYDGRWSEYRQRTVGAALPATISGRRFVSFTQNHDQIGNRARGRRLTELTSPQRVRFGIALLCLSPTVPMLFMGEEYGETNPFLFFSSHPEPELAAAIREGRRQEFAAFVAFGNSQVPDPQDPATLAASVLDPAHAEAPEGLARRRLWTDLLRLRRTTPALATGVRTLVRALHATPTQMAVLRDGPAGAPPVLVAANAHAAPAVVPVDVAGDWRVRWSSTAVAYGGSGEQVTLDQRDDVVACTLPAWAVGVLATEHTTPGDTSEVAGYDASRS